MMGSYCDRHRKPIRPEYLKMSVKNVISGSKYPLFRRNLNIYKSPRELFLVDFIFFAQFEFAVDEYYEYRLCEQIYAFDIL